MPAMDLMSDVTTLSLRYRSASPWPHLVIDGLFDSALVSNAHREELSGALRLAPNRSNRLIKAETPQVDGPSSASILGYLNSPEFVRFLSALTGVEDLLVDPTHWWAGLHVLAPGSFQSLHYDFSRQGQTGLFHRVNVLVYLTDGWAPAYGGALELWDPESMSQVQSVDPLAGRVVIFETTGLTLHGVQRVDCPEGQARLTLASYYYTVRRGPQSRRGPQYFGLPRRPGEPLSMLVAIPKDRLRRLTEGVRSRLEAK